MATLNFPGLATGIDTSTLIQQLLAIEGRTRDIYQQRVNNLQDKKTDIDTFRTDLVALQSAVKALSDADSLRAFNITSSDENILTAEATSNAFEGNHTVVVNQLATADRWVNNTGYKYAEDYVGAGNFIYSYDGKEAVVTTSSTTSLEDLVGLINNDADNPGVTASLLFFNNAYHLVLNGNDAGSDYGISVNSSSTEIWQADDLLTVGSDNATLTTQIIMLDQFGDNPLQGGETISIAGTDHYGNAITPITLSLTDNTKISHLIDSIEEAYNGNVKATFENGRIIVTDKFSGASSLSVSLTYNANGSSATLDLPTLAMSSEGGTASATLAGFAATDFTRSQVAQDSKIKVDGYPSSAAVSEVQQITHSATTGTFKLSYGGFTTDLIAADASVADIQAALETLPGVEAGDITVSGDAISADGTLTFTFKNTIGDASSILIDSSGLSNTLAVTEQTKGIDEWISRSSNTVTNVLYGLTLHLHDVTDASGEQITLTRDVAAVTSKLTTMITAYNTLASYIKEKTGYNTQTKMAGTLMGDYVVTDLKSSLYMGIVTQTKGFIEDADSFLMPGQIGLELDSDGVLSLDNAVFSDAIAKDYMGVLAVIGADKSGSSNSNTIRFSQASSEYTTAGQYDVEVTIAGGAITSARIKLSTDTTWRDATFSGNTITGNSAFDSNGLPVYPENSLLLGVDLSQDGTFNATVSVKQGFAGVLKDILDKALKSTTGSVDLDEAGIDDMIENLQDRIDEENDRLTRKQDALTAKFARLEATMTLLRSQMAVLTGSL